MTFLWRPKTFFELNSPPIEIVAASMVKMVNGNQITGSSPSISHYLPSNVGLKPSGQAPRHFFS